MPDALLLICPTLNICRSPSPSRLAFSADPLLPQASVRRGLRCVLAISSSVCALCSLCSSPSPPHTTGTIPPASLTAPRTSSTPIRSSRLSLRPTKFYNGYRRPASRHSSPAVGLLSLASSLCFPLLPFFALPFFCFPLLFHHFRMLSYPERSFLQAGWWIRSVARRFRRLQHAHSPPRHPG